MISLNQKRPYTYLHMQSHIELYVKEEMERNKVKTLQMNKE